MITIDFPGNEQDCSFTYFKVREGPNYFVSYYKGSTRGHLDPKDCWRVLGDDKSSLGVAKFTTTGNALKDWAIEVSLDEQSPDLTTDDGGSEGGARAEQTKMVI